MRIKQLEDYDNKQMFYEYTLPYCSVSENFPASRKRIFALGLGGGAVSSNHRDLFSVVPVGCIDITKRQARLHRLPVD
jgi:hypothetical protein